MSTYNAARLENFYDELSAEDDDPGWQRFRDYLVHELVQNNVGRRRFQSGDHVLDLHGMSLSAAEEAVQLALDDAERKPRTLLIVTGKGKHSDGAPILKEGVASMLEKLQLRVRASVLQDGFYVQAWRGKREAGKKPKAKHLGAAGLVHALRDMVDAEETKGEAGRWLGQGSPLPASIRELDYWTAVEAFELYDVRKEGFLDKTGFYTMLKGITRKKLEKRMDYMDEQLSDRIFDEIDINESGDIDKEEFLGWVFQTNNFRLNHLREKLVTMTQEEILMARSIDDLHEFIDVDNSGLITFDEFLNWVHPDRELQITTACSFELLRAEIGPDYHFIAERIKLMLSQIFSPGSVLFQFETDGRVAGTCSRVTAKVGRGIELWNRDTMMAYREDPFLDPSGSKARQWLTDVLHKCLPDVERAANLYRLKYRNGKPAHSRQGSKQRLQPLNWPSPVARDLVRRLLTPKRQVRCNAKEALQHRWITSPPSETRADEAQAQDAPLLQWSDFEEGLTGIQREFQRAAEESMTEVVQAVENIQIGSDLEQQILLDPKDDRLKNCVVCFQESGHFGFFCKQCYHSVCIQCLVKLPKPECPHCRKPASDAGSVAWKAALEVGSNVAENLGKVGADAVVDIDLGHIRPVTEEQRKRSSACCVCDTPAGATNHVCPECFASVCFPCAKKLKERQCPSCGDVDHNAEPLKHYLAAAEAWDAAMGLATRAGEAPVSSGITRGIQAKAEAPAPKAKAKANMVPPGRHVTASAKSMGGPPSTAAATGPAPRQVLNIVSGKPQPGGVVGSTASAVGPARGYAQAAANVLPGEAPKLGPAAAAVGRAMAEGRSPAVSNAGGKLRLGEAMDGLPIALAALGHRVMVVSPRYDQYAEGWDTSYWSSVPMGGKQESVHFFHAHKQKVDYVFVDHPTFLERVDGMTGAKLYGPEWGKDGLLPLHAYNQARFAYFCKASLKAIQELALGGAAYGGNCVVVANDWHSALVPMLIHAEKSVQPGKWNNTKTVFLCHNAVFQGRLASILGVPDRYLDSITFKMPLRIGKYNEKVSCINTMSAGLRYSDRAITVSPTYARECVNNPEKGAELEALFHLASDNNFVMKTMMTCGMYSADTCDSAKSELKMAYRAQNGLPSSSGRADLVQQTKALEKKHPSKIFYAGWMGPERYALLAACDYTLLPSRWEPCGLVQMEAMRLGTLPIVAPTGGLKDTDGVNGLWTDKEMTIEAIADQASVDSLSNTLQHAVKLFRENPPKVVDMKKAAMAASQEFTWTNAALQYEAVFQELGATDVLPLCGGQATVTLEVDKQVC
eukprot:g1275.t1